MKISDVQIVSMHWGQEYNTSITEEQDQLANYLNELGVEVIIGHHPHVIEPAEIIQQKIKILSLLFLRKFLKCPR